ncbi:hypothetical protein [Pseudomonas sp. 1152_12]|uniref:hypothetical protein n=1 Tax=Pseudomonas sp. 1152_12 TaxID=2604455 RepID=UPI00406423EB
MVQGIAIAGVALSQCGLFLSRGGQVPTGQFHFVVGKFFLTLGGGLGEPGGRAVFEEVVVNTPKVNIEAAFGGGGDGLF